MNDGFLTGRSVLPTDIYGDLPLLFKKQREKYDSALPYTPKYIKDNVTRSSDPGQLYTNRVRGRQILLQNPVGTSRARQQREQRKAKQVASNARVHAGVIGQKQAREKGLWKLDKSEAKFERFVALHRLWMGYMSELLALAPPPSGPECPDYAQAMPNSATMHAKLIKADFSGAMISVRKSKNPCLIGLSGIVYHETENTFKIITDKDQLKLIPKANSIFNFSVPLYATSSPNEDASSVDGATDGPIDHSTLTSSVPPNATVLDLPHIEFELYGNQFCFRSADRASRKFKHKETIEL